MSGVMGRAESQIAVADRDGSGTLAGKGSGGGEAWTHKGNLGSVLDEDGLSVKEVSAVSCGLSR